MTVNVRYLAALIIHAVTQGRSLNDVLSTNLSQLKDARDRSLLQSLTFEVCRYYFRLKIILNQFIQKPLKNKDKEIEALLLIGIYQLLETRIPPHAVLSETVNAVKDFKKIWAKALVNAILRKVLNQLDEIKGHILTDEMAHYAHDHWLIQKIKHQWPHHWQMILNANNQIPPLSLRINQQLMSRETYCQKFSEFNFVPIPETNSGVILGEKKAVEQIPGFMEGLISVQDGGAQLAAPLLDLRNNDHVLDAASAPGGKLCHALEKETVNIIAIEKNKERAQKIHQNLNRLQLKATVIVEDANNINNWWNGKPFDRILLDVPCSGSGVIRRHPDIKLLRNPKDLINLQHQQHALLQNLWPLLKPNGLLLYATCSIFAEENENILTHFLRENKNAMEEKITAKWGIEREIGRQVLPGMHMMDGFYYALFRKLS